MSEIEIKEAAERYANYNYYEYARGIATGCFIAGCEYADKEAYNRCLDEVDIALGRVFDGVSPELHEEIIEELQKLRK
jgi:hypothetical protein